MASSVDSPTAIQVDTCYLCTLRAEDCSHSRLAQSPPEELLHYGQFYRVYDGLSQSRYSPEDGFLCGEDDPLMDLPERRFSRLSVKRHLDWDNREPTSYISIFSSLEAALGECERWLARPWVKDRASGRFVHRGEVRVAAITGLETFSRHRVFLTSLSELHRTHVLNHDDDFASRPEWLVLDHIPPPCVLADGTATQFIEFCRA